eukprot:c4228_g1_i1.p1 GENE.c4228_g1_i1~~c4228_g1_i1.p1  ORF type:complete len:359 (-),score=86.90 c4228_g1_i1:18-1094(-)
MPTSQAVVVLDYQDLVAEKDLSAEIARAYGFDGLGILAVRGVPGFDEKRRRLLPLARAFALLPEHIKQKYEHPQSYYSFGWSHGKEKFNGAADLAKGSFYANPQYDRPVDDEQVVNDHIAFVHPNIWPDEDMPGFSEAFKQCGQLMVEVGQLIAKQCDRYVSSLCPTYEANKLERIIQTSKCCKARLLHYFDLTDKSAECRADSWCGWHNDHGSLTALCPGMFIDENGDECSCPDPAAGLYIHTRTGKTVKAAVPDDCMAFQIGETAQVHSGGLLQATPHCVMGGKARAVSRESFAVFMEPNWDEQMNVPTDVDPANAMMGSRLDLIPHGVPLLEKRWSNDQDFNAFTDKTLRSYYEY